MAEASMKDIRQRIRSVKNTMQITRAMQMVASSKLGQARRRMENSRPYLETAGDILEDIAGRSAGSKSLYLHARAPQRKCLVVVAGDRGLAGSYNANVFSYVRGEMKASSCCAIPIGQKAQDYFAAQGMEKLDAGASRAEGLDMAACRRMALLIMEAFEAGRIDGADLVYTGFVSVLAQQVQKLRLLPIRPRKASGQRRQIIFEPGADELIQSIMQDFLAGMIYAAVCEAVASEQAARRVAMDAAARNSAEMIEDLKLRLNRARQASITQELTEIAAGAQNDSEER